MAKVLALTTELAVVNIKTKFFWLFLPQTRFFERKSLFCYNRRVVKIRKIALFLAERTYV